MTVVGATIYFACTDESFAVEPEYDRKAANWDEMAAQRERNVALGWSAVISEGYDGAGAPPWQAEGPPYMSVALRDRDGQLIADAQVEAIAFHHADASHWLRLEMVEDETSRGIYVAPQALERPGLWELRFTIRRGADVFTQTVSHIIPQPASREREQ